MRRKQLRFYEKEKKINARLLGTIGMWIFQVAVAAAIGVVAAFFWGNKAPVIGSSMEPQIESGTNVWINKASYMLSSPERYDVVVFKPHGNQKDHYYVKRVIGLPGETIQIINGQVYIDGELLKEEEQRDPIEDPGIASEPYTIGNEEYFVLGDNRNNSEDSRYADIGTIKFDDIEGSAWLWSGEGFHFGYIR